MAAALRRLNAVSATVRQLSTQSRFISIPRTALLSCRHSYKVAPIRTFHHQTARAQQASHAQQPAEDEEASSSQFTRFDDLSRAGLVDDAVIKPILRLGFTEMTPVQQLTIPTSLEGIDVVAQAKTGTGKTLAFLIPLIQNMLKRAGGRMPRHRYGDMPSFNALIVSPTRELAEQIAQEAEKICNNSETGIVLQTAVGGTGRAQGLRALQQRGCHILVGTPGRLNDILSDPGTGVQAPNLSTLVLDEADRLLDQGFLPQIESIVKCLPDPQQVDRQTMLFSATLPKSIMSIVQSTMKPDFEFVQTVDPNEAPTHERVPQKVVNVGGLENLLPTLLEIVKREKAAATEDIPFKALVYLPSTAMVHFAASVFQNLGVSGDRGMYTKTILHPTAVYEIHAKLSQAQRTSTTQMFKRAKSAMLFSSDVTSRGMDFPNVTHVFQLGLPQTRDDYVHRIGRTARAGKDGTGYFLHTDIEKFEVRKRLGGLPLVPDHSLQTAGVDMSARAELPTAAAETLMQIGEATKLVDRRSKEDVYRALVGSMGFVDGATRIEAMNRLSQFGWGWSEPPTLSPGIVHKLGLRGIPGVRVGNPMEYSGGGFGQGGSFQDGGSRGGFGRGGLGQDRGREGGFGRSGARQGGAGGFDRMREAIGSGGRSNGGGFGGRRFNNNDRRSGGFGSGGFGR